METQLGRHIIWYLHSLYYTNQFNQLNLLNLVFYKENYRDKAYI
jgi:hypothetical protein